ncbi:uncharacterized protein LOC142240484 [Haematobia irritans]|uniref:uncharacterized protein LOC142240484 n=1 Tax=Haematobia irritans TaxID=7368 RepID=UPI003F50C2D6
MRQEFLLHKYQSKIPIEQESMTAMSLDSPRTPDSHTTQTPLIYGQNRMGPSSKPQGQDTPYVRFYSVGPKTNAIICPLCKEKTETVNVNYTNLIDGLNCLMSCLSCCFPIFALSCIYTMCCRGSSSSQRKYCRKCGGYLGLYSRPK